MTGTLVKITSHYSIIVLCLLVIVSSCVEAFSKRHCTDYGHSCYGGHGKRSSPNEPRNLENVDADSTITKDENRGDLIIEDLIASMDSEETRRLRDRIMCDNCDVKSSRRSRDNRNYLPLLISKMLASDDRLFREDLTSNDE